MELPESLKPFDYGTISDVVLHMRYTARDGGRAFREMVTNELRVRLNTIVLKTGRVGLFQAFDLRRDRPDAWHQLRTKGETEVTFSTIDFPYFSSSMEIEISPSQILARVKDADTFEMTISGAGAVTLTKASEEELDGLLSNTADELPPLGTPISIGSAAACDLEEMTIIVNYKMK